MSSLRTHAHDDKSSRTTRDTSLVPTRPERPGPLRGQAEAWRAARAAGCSDKALLVWSAFASRWNWRRPGWRAEVSIDTVGSEVGCSRSTVQRSMRALESAGLLRITGERSKYGSAQGVHVVELLAPAAIRRSPNARTQRAEAPQRSHVEDTPGVSQLCNPIHSSTKNYTPPTPPPPSEESATPARTPAEAQGICAARALGLQLVPSPAERAHHPTEPSGADQTESRPERPAAELPTRGELHQEHDGCAPDEARPEPAAGSEAHKVPPAGRAPRARRRDRGPAPAHVRYEAQGPAPQPYKVGPVDVEAARPLWPDVDDDELALALIAAHQSWEAYGWKAYAPVDDERRTEARDLYVKRSVRGARERWKRHGIKPSSTDPRRHTAPATPEEYDRARKRERAPLVQVEQLARELQHDDGGREMAEAMAALKSQSAKKTVHGKVLKSGVNERTKDPPNNLCDLGPFSTSNAQNGAGSPNVAAAATDGGPWAAFVMDCYAERERLCGEEGTANDDES